MPLRRSTSPAIRALPDELPFGYYDQMHMVHDFAEFAGGTPTQTLRRMETVFVEQIRVVRSVVRCGNRTTAADPDLRLMR